MDIVRTDQDRQRFLSLLFYLNDEFKDEYWEQRTKSLERFERPQTWPERKPLVDILAFTLMPNHIHLLLKEIREGGVSRLTQKVFGSMTTHFNLKYQETGSMFQGPYKARLVTNDEYLRYVACYIMIKNTFELFPHGGLLGAARDFDAAWKWALSFPYSSFATYASTSTPGKSDSPASDFIVASDNILHQIFHSKKEFKKVSRDMLYAYIEKRNEDFSHLQLED